MKSEIIQIPDIHVGNMIVDFLKANGRSQAYLARCLEMNTANLNKILKRKSIETEKLFEICIVLEHNFFAIYGGDPDIADGNYTLGEPELGLHIEKRMRDLKMTQNEFASKIGISRSDVNRILKKSSFDTDKLTDISRALGYNFFKDFYRTYDGTEENLREHYRENILTRLEELIIENDRLKQELQESKDEVDRLNLIINNAGLKM